MKFSKKMTKFLAVLAMSAMLLATTASASTIKTPNMGGVSVQYAALVTATKDFDDPLSASILNAVTTQYCYNEADVLKMIANTNSAIDAIKKIEFINSTNGTAVQGTNLSTLVRDNGFVLDAKNYLSGAQLAGAVSFSFGSSNSQFIMAPATGSNRPLDQYYDTVEFKVTTPLYSGTTPIKLVAPAEGVTYNATTLVHNVDIFAKQPIIDKLENYVKFLNAVIAFDRAAGCFDTTDVTPPTTPTPLPPVEEAYCGYIYADDIEICVGDDFDIMDDVYAEDDFGNDLTDLITVDGEVNTAEPGDYYITYSLPDCDEVTIVVTVLPYEEEEPPYIEPETDDAVIYADDVNLGCDEGSFDPYDHAYAVDDGGYGEDISYALTVSGNVNTAVAGTYNVVYSVIGENGVLVSETITVTVETESLNAVIEGVKDRTIFLGDPFDALEGVKAYDVDGRDTDITEDIEVEGYVDTASEGDYYLTYTVMGSCGVAVSKDSVVTVKKEIFNALIVAYDRTINCDCDFDKMRDVRAYDNNGAGKDITGDVWVDGFVDTHVEGDYLLTYHVIGSNGLRVDREVIITVACQVSPGLGATEEICCDVPVGQIACYRCLLPVCNCSETLTEPDSIVENNVTCFRCLMPVCICNNYITEPVSVVETNVTYCNYCYLPVCICDNYIPEPVVPEPVAPAVTYCNYCYLPVCICETDIPEPVVPEPVAPVVTYCNYCYLPICICETDIPEPVAPVDVYEPEILCFVPVICFESEPAVPVAPVEVEEPIRIVIDPIRIEIIVDCEEVLVPVDCEEVLVPVECEEPVVPVECEEVPAVPVECEEVPEAPVECEETPAPAAPAEEPAVMKPTGANIAELAFSCLSLLGTAVLAKKRRY